MLTPLFASRASVETFSNPNKLDFLRLIRFLFALIRPVQPSEKEGSREKERKGEMERGTEKDGRKKQNQKREARREKDEFYLPVGRASIQFPGRCFSFRVSKLYNDAVITPATRGGPRGGH